MTASRATAVEVSGLCKSFQIPIHRAETLKERVIRPHKGDQHRELKVLNDISFSVERGEFFGVVGRNGSGKSTLLKVLASVYSADSGRVRVAGTVAPIIELGVGFQPEMNARDNVFLNALMLGLTTPEARRCFDAVIEFAELEDFTEMKLKNFSTGMRARLAFAIAIQADPDVLLLDEVLSVGDPPFQRRCQEVFEEIRGDRSKTVLLVTHSIFNIERYCDRAMLLDGGRIGYIGDPKAVGNRYAQLGAEPDPSTPTQPIDQDHAPSPARIADLELVDQEGNRSRSVGFEAPFQVLAWMQSPVPVDAPRLLLQILNKSGARVLTPPPIDLASEADRLNIGEAVKLETRIENELPSGEYTIRCIVATGPFDAGLAVSEPATIDFEVVSADDAQGAGTVNLGYGSKSDGDSESAESRVIPG